MRCRRNVAMVVPRPKRPLRTRSRICAVSISGITCTLAECLSKAGPCSSDAASVVCGHRMSANAAEFQVSPEDQSDQLSFFFDDRDLALLHLIAKGQGASDPKALSL